MKGLVIGRTSRVAFVRLIDGQLVAIHDVSVPAFPFSWVASRWRTLGLECGTSVELAGGQLVTWAGRVPGRRLPPGRLRRARDRGMGLGVSMRDLGTGSAVGLASVGALEAGLADGDLPARLAGVVGRGPGLTPSGDDVVVGLLAGLAIAGDDASGSRLRDALGSLGPTLESRTTAVSAGILDAALEGAFAPVLADLAEAADTGSAARMAAAVDRLEAIGATTGGDMLAGLALGVHTGGLT